MIPTARRAISCNPRRFSWCCTSRARPAATLRETSGKSCITPMPRTPPRRSWASTRPVSRSSTRRAELWRTSVARPANANLYLYADSGFTAPAAAISGGITAVGDPLQQQQRHCERRSFHAVRCCSLPSRRPAACSLYRLAYTGAPATREYAAAGNFGSSVSDGTNLYFTDNGTLVRPVDPSAAPGGRHPDRVVQPCYECLVQSAIFARRLQRIVVGDVDLD